MTPRQAADLLGAARLAHHTLVPFTDTYPNLDEDWGYAAQVLSRKDSVASPQATMSSARSLG